MAARQLTIPLAWKARTAVAGLLLLLLWPPAHYALVERYRLDPWKYFGFAMYCRPSLPVQLETRALGPDGWTRIDPRRLPRGAQREWGALLRGRATLGDLRTPDALAARIFRLQPEVRELEFVITHARLETGSGRIVADPVEVRIRREPEAVP